jgi:CheY-like chemotaxis protein
MSRTILIVDDHVETCRVLARLFSRNGIPAECVTSGSAAMQYLERQTPGCVILDYMMPGMDGLETLQRMRAMGDGGATVPVALYTASRDTWLREQALALGAHDIWSKADISFAEMRDHVQKWLA